MANPPITIGPFNNVPAPGSPIASNWPQSISTFVTNTVVRRDVAALQDIDSALQVGAHPVGGVGVLLDIAGTISGSFGGAVGAPSLYLRRGGTADANGGVYAQFLVQAGTAIGSITRASPTTVAYNTTSDPRLKERVGDNLDALDRVAELGRHGFRGRWIGDVDDAHDWDMLSAVDIAAVAPYAVTGDPDAVDDNGNIVPMQANYPALVPLLIAALAQAADRIAALEAGA